jgi:hypothetical protein
MQGSQRRQWREPVRQRLVPGLTKAGENPGKTRCFPGGRDGLDRLDSLLKNGDWLRQNPEKRWKYQQSPVPVPFFHQAVEGWIQMNLGA